MTTKAPRAATAMKRPRESRSWLAIIFGDGRRVAGIDADRLPLPQSYFSGRKPTRLADVRHAAKVHVDLPRLPRAGVPGGELGGARRDLARQLGQTIGIADDDVTAGHAVDVQPEVVWIGDTERQLVVLSVAPADQDLEAAGVHEAVRTS